MQVAQLGVFSVLSLITFILAMILTAGCVIALRKAIKSLLEPVTVRTFAISFTQLMLVIMIYTAANNAWYWTWTNTISLFPLMAKLFDVFVEPNLNTVMNTVNTVVHNVA